MRVGVSVRVVILLVLLGTAVIVSSFYRNIPKHPEDSPTRVPAPPPDPHIVRSVPLAQPTPGAPPERRTNGSGTRETSDNSRALPEHVAAPATSAIAPQTSQQRAADAGRESPKPIPSLAHVQHLFESTQNPLLKESARRMSEMEYEPQDAWSEDTEARLRNFMATQPQADHVEATVSCRASQCMVQISDLQQNAPGTPSASETIFYGMTRQPWFSLLLQHDQSQLMSVGGRPSFIGFFTRVQ